MTTTSLTHTMLVRTEPIERTEDLGYVGILTSNYKEKAKENFRNVESSSLFGLKQRIRTNQHRFTPAAGAILKVSIFVIAYAIAFL
jgi:hypothetical protein